MWLSGEQTETFAGLILRLFSSEKVSTVLMCLFTEDKQSAQICQQITVCNQISKDFYMNFTSRQNYVGKSTAFKMMGVISVNPSIY